MESLSFAFGEQAGDRLTARADKGDPAHAPSMVSVGRLNRLPLAIADAGVGQPGLRAGRAGG